MKKSVIPLTKHTLWFFEGDVQALAAIAGTKIGASQIIRLLTRKYIREYEAKLGESQPLPKVEFDI